MKSWELESTAAWWPQVKYKTDSSPYCVSNITKGDNESKIPTLVVESGDQNDKNVPINVNPRMIFLFRDLSLCHCFYHSLIRLRKLWGVIKLQRYWFTSMHICFIRGKNILSLLYA